MVTLQDITRDNWFSCAKLQVTEQQSKLFTAPVVFWIAESKYETHYRPVAIYADDTIVGFAIYIVGEDGSGEIEAILIDKRYQSRGYGRAAMKLLIALLAEAFHCRTIRLSHRPGNAPAAALYESFGFVEESRTDEAVVRLLTV